MLAGEADEKEVAATATGNCSVAGCWGVGVGVGRVEVEGIAFFCCFVFFSTTVLVIFRGFVTGEVALLSPSNDMV